ARGVRRAWPAAQVELLPVADGGEGWVETLVRATSGRLVTRQVTGPLGEPVEAQYGLFQQDGEDVAVIEMAAASGLTLVPPDRRDPRVTTTRGTGELIRDALDQGARRLLVGIGGSATNDGGAGMAQALGVRFLDEAGAELPPGGAALARLARVDLSGLDPRLAQTEGVGACEVDNPLTGERGAPAGYGPPKGAAPQVGQELGVARVDLSGLDPRLAQTEVVVACDVDNPLTGERGAAAVYGPQKGATPEMVQELDAALAHFADVVEGVIGRSLRELPGAGAAGGLGFGLMAFAGARLQRGIELALETLQADRHFAWASLVITGEGRIDRQTLHGKVPFGVARRAAAFGVPVV